MLGLSIFSDTTQDHLRQICKGEKLAISEYINFYLYQYETKRFSLTCQADAKEEDLYTVHMFP